jgi:hypothetical protein
VDDTVTMQEGDGFEDLFEVNCTFSLRETFLCYEIGYLSTKLPKQVTTDSSLEHQIYVFVIAKKSVHFE